MAYKEVVINRPRPEVVTIVKKATPVEVNTFATGNLDKLRELSQAFGHPVEGRDLKVPEIQDLDPDVVVTAKAIEAYIANNYEPIGVDDTSLSLFAMDGLPGPFVSQFTETGQAKQNLCQIAALRGDNRALATVKIAVFDGQEVHIRTGTISGTIVDKPRGTGGFGWDDIIEPNGQEELAGWDGKRRTFAELLDKDPLAKKDPNISMRAKAAEAVTKDPFVIGTQVYKMSESYPMQTEAIKIELLHNKTARNHAYNLLALDGNKPEKDFSITTRKPYHEVAIGPGFKRYTPNPNSATMGIVVTPMDLVRSETTGKPLRLEVTNNGDPKFWSMGPESVKMALAARANEFMRFHNPEMYKKMRAMLDKTEVTTPRSNTQSPAIEELLGIIRKKEKEGKFIENDGLDLEKEEIFGAHAEPEELEEVITSTQTAATSQLGYARQYSPKTMSRTDAAINGLFVTTAGLPSSLFSIGAMPPVSGSPDVLATAALSFMDAIAPRNGIFVNFDRRLRLFQESQEQIQKLGLPKDIEKLVIGHIGVAVGVEDTKKTEEEVKALWEAGCTLLRYYTTNPDHRTIDGVKAGRQAVGKDMRMGFHPVADMEQARQLIHPDIAINLIMAGHGGGENCSSLEGGGAANSLELAYRMSLDPAFNDTAIGLEGGVGSYIGPLIGFIDQISLNKRGVAGGIELGGLYVQHSNGRMVVPYPGSASPNTQWTEALTDPDIAAKRVNNAGVLINVEGKGGYMEKPRWATSIVHAWERSRMFAGRALADQRSRSINDLRKNIGENGYNHRIVSPDALDIAMPHRAIT